MDFLDRKASLTELADKYGTDKGTLGPSDGWGANNYTDIYQAYLEPLRDQPLVFLEIGIGVKGPHWEARIVRGRNQGGASLKMWSDYFPQARILGLDINDASFLDTDRISTFQVDQGNPEDLQKFCQDAVINQFDVVVDDGSHHPEHQQVSFSFFFPLLKPGGLYFIEDLQDNGLGDGRTGRSASSRVLNTRKIFYHFQRSGSFPDPHLITAPKKIGDEIDYLNFHCPHIQRRYQILRRGRRFFKKGYRYRPDSHRLVLIAKKS